ncbi:uncharacterized protein CEXT_439151 [Caerostris extrusa]|uniref:Uncharacterized protein n=1 Tax=Caerostris extrusa TaxID=172846 RepID=A0AAV4N334_CAEEX|nr:uncharacterized protein CEXT_439151 [Caerostris extrusa]
MSSFPYEGGSTFAYESQSLLSLYNDNIPSAGNKAVWTIKSEEGKGRPRANIRLSPPCYSSSCVLCNGRYAGEIAGQVRHNHVHFQQLMSV